MATPSFRQKESCCELSFNQALKQYGEFWHYFTPGEETGVILLKDEDFRHSITDLALSAAENDVRIITDAHMSTHLHTLFAGKKDNCDRALGAYRSRLMRRYSRQGLIKNLSGIRCLNPIAITDLHQMRNTIVYINRNGYVDDPRYTPFSYPWSCGTIYFNSNTGIAEGKMVSEMSYREKRALFMSRGIDIPESTLGYQVIDEMILPESYSLFRLGEAMFRDAHHYINHLFKNIEAYCQEADRLKDSIILTYEELFNAIRSFCRTEYNQIQPSLIPADAKIKVAQMMKNKYNASNKQIGRILNLTDEFVSRLFPLSSHLGKK